MGANVPDLRGRVLQERDAAHTVGSIINAGLPNITGGEASAFVHWYTGNISGIGALRSHAPNRNHGVEYNPGAGSGYGTISFNAALSNPIYGNSETVQPPAYAVRYLIRALP